MSIINRHECCWGLTLWKWKQLRVELWYCPSGYEIKEHSHPKENVELMYLFGSTTFYRRVLVAGKKTEKVEWAIMSKKFFGKTFSVKCFHSHWFTVGKWPLIFINIQRFLPGYKPESAAKDFVVTL